MNKKLLLIAVVLLVIGMVSVADAKEFSCDGFMGPLLNKCVDTYKEPNIRSTTGIMFDAPYLIRFTKNWTLGLEGGKEIYLNAFQDSATWVEDDKGFFGFIKITYSGTLFSFAK